MYAFAESAPPLSHVSETLLYLARQARDEKRVLLNLQRDCFHLLASSLSGLILVTLDGYSNVVMGTNDSLIVLGETHRSKFNPEPALSLVPDPRPPPKGC